MDGLIKLILYMLKVIEKVKFKTKFNLAWTQTRDLTIITFCANHCVTTYVYK